MATDLALGRPLSVSSSVSLAMTETTPCVSCDTVTDLTMAYADGEVVTLALKGHVNGTSSGAIPPPAIPSIPNIPFPNAPEPGNSSGGTATF